MHLPRIVSYDLRQSIVSRDLFRHANLLEEKNGHHDLSERTSARKLNDCAAIQFQRAETKQAEQIPRKA
jgi:hypothetical protein